MRRLQYSGWMLQLQSLQLRGPALYTISKQGRTRQAEPVIVLWGATDTGVGTAVKAAGDKVFAAEVDQWVVPVRVTATAGQLLSMSGGTPWEREGTCRGQTASEDQKDEAGWLEESHGLYSGSQNIMNSF